MSRKINSNLLKINKFNRWSFNHIIKTKEEMPFFFIKNYVIFNVLKTILAKYKLLTLNCKLYKTNSLIHIYLSYINIRKKKNKKFKW